MSDISMYIICGIDSNTNKRWLAHLGDRDMWYHKDRVAEACDELRSRQTNPNVSYKVFKYIPIMEETC